MQKLKQKLRTNALIRDDQEFRRLGGNLKEVQYSTLFDYKTSKPKVIEIGHHRAEGKKELNQSRTTLMTAAIKVKLFNEGITCEHD